MNITIEVTGGTDKTVRTSVYINDEKTGELQMARADFTRFCGLLFGNSYNITGVPQEHQIA